MKKIFLIAYLFLFTMAASVAQELDRSKVPAPGPAPKINIGSYKTFTLKNGLQVFVVENHNIPRVSFQLSLDIDPIKEGEIAGYVSMAGDLMKKGTTTKTKDQINEELDFVGANLSTFSSGMFASSLTKHKDVVLGLMMDVLMNPIFPEEELEKSKKEMISNLASNKTDPDAISGNVAGVLRYGKDHPYGEMLTEKTVEAINIDHIKEYYKKYYKPNKAYLVILGDIKYKDAKKVAKKYFSKWEKGIIPQHEYDMPKAPEKTSVALVDKAGAVQSVINITYPIQLKPGSKDIIKARMMNTILGGGGFNARLMQNIREDKGWTYGAYSSLASDELVGYFNATAKVRNDVTDSAVVEFLKEMQRMIDEDIDEELLQLTKNKLTGSFGRSLESPQTVAGFALNIAKYNLPSDYYETYLQKVQAVTVADIKAMAKKYIRPENAHILIVGSASELKGKMKQFGEVTQYDTYGEEVVIDESALPAGLTAEKVVEKYLEARGGRDKVAGVKDIYSELDMKVGPTTLKMVIAEEAPDKKTIIQSMNGQQVGKQVFTADKAMMSSPMGNKVFEGEELEAVKHQGIMHPELDYAKHGYSIKLTGKSMVDDEAVYQVEVTTPAGDKEINSYSVETGLLVQVYSAKAGTQKFSNYLPVQGVKFPYNMTMESPMGAIEITLTKVKVNEGIEASMFE